MRFTGYQLLIFSAKGYTKECERLYKSYIFNQWVDEEFKVNNFFSTELFFNFF